jgi:hypothetical protein
MAQQQQRQHCWQQRATEELPPTVSKQTVCLLVATAAARLP